MKWGRRGGVHTLAWSRGSQELLGCESEVYCFLGTVGLCLPEGWARGMFNVERKFSARRFGAQARETTDLPGFTLSPDGIAIYWVLPEASARSGSGAEYVRWPKPSGRWN